MLKGGTNHTMIWLISQFPAKHTDVGIGAKIKYWRSLVPGWLDFWDTVMEL